MNGCLDRSQFLKPSALLQASSKGRFEFDGLEMVDLHHASKTYMALSPFSPRGIECGQVYYEPFTRFGKFGGVRALSNAFKKPLLLADTASVIHFGEPKEIQYIGEAITNVSDSHDAVHQGYSIVIPMKELS